MSAHSSTPRFQAEVELSIPFYDLDPIGVVWHGHYAKYFELARCALLDQFNYGYDAMRDSGYMWPVIDMQVRYVKPLVFGQRVKVSANLREWEYRLLIDYVIKDAVSGKRSTKGTTSQVAVDIKTREMSLMSPRVLFERLGLEA